MQVENIAIDQLSISKANMQQGKKPHDVSDILPSIIKRGVIIPVIVRPNCDEGHFEICAGKRRYYASLAAQAAGKEDVTLPCIQIAANNDAEALEISMIENMLRQAPDAVTQWESYTRLVKEGRSVDDIAATFALTELQVKRILVLGNLLPRTRDAYRAEEIDAETIRHLTLATKAQQKAWLALFDGEDGCAPRGQQLKAWLFGGGAISVKAALFDMADYSGQIVTNLFEEGGYFADSDAFWAAQSAEIEKRKAQYLEDGWSPVEIVPPQSHFSTWEHEKAPKRKGGRIYIAVNNRGEVTFHEGYVTQKEGQRLRKAEAEGKDGTVLPKMARPELTSTLTSYVDLHRHAAVRAELASHPSVALRVMVAHAIAGSPLWKVEVQSQRTRNDAINESIETCPAEVQFDERRRAVLGVLGFDAERATVTSGRYPGNHIGPLVERLLELPDRVVMEVAAMVMAETLATGSDLIETLGVPLVGRYGPLLDDRRSVLRMLARPRGGDRHSRRGPRRSRRQRQRQGKVQDYQERDCRLPDRREWAGEARGVGAALDGLPAFGLYRARWRRHGQGFGAGAVDCRTGTARRAGPRRLCQCCRASYRCGGAECGCSACPRRRR